MTDEQNDDALLAAEELDSLKDRAKQLGVDFHPSIGYEKLAAKVKDFMAAKDAEKAPAPVAAPSAAMTQRQINARMKKEQMALVRVRITCMDPNKREWEGEIFSAGNRVIGQVKKMVPYDQIFHVPRIILTMIQEKQCQIFQTVKDNRGNKGRKGKLIKAFGVEILPDLTATELKELAQRQAMARGTAEA